MQLTTAATPLTEALPWRLFFVWDLQLKYTKPALSAERHLKVLEKRGLQIPDSDKALHYLKYIGYYRLTGYCLPFQGRAPEDHFFLEGTSFDDVLNLYVFDRELRIYVLDAMERIELAFRTVISNTMSLAYGPHWYLNEDHFGKRYGGKASQTYDHAKLLKTITKADSISLRHYRKKYTDPIEPPSWIMIESLSFGGCSILFAHLRKAHVKLISKAFDLDPTLLVSWIQGLVLLRNLCAHHGRIWNRKFSHRPSTHGEIPEVLLENIDRDNRFYVYASLIIYFLRSFSPDTSWVKKLSKLIEVHQDIRISDMGFPKDWKERELWKHFL